jgi:inosine/xanthosine triphosphate pyrophosphatase family protein
LAKRKKNQRDLDDFNRWYDVVDDNATPDNVFWEEMERQRQLTEIAETSPPSSTATTMPMYSGIPGPGIKPDKGMDATLAEYAAFMVDDNWLDDELAVLMQDDIDFGDLEEQNQQIDQEFDGLHDHDDNAWMTSDEPWDHWGEKEDFERRDVLKVNPNRESEFLFTEEDDDGEEAARLEAEHLSRISRLSLSSRRLEAARNNAKAATFFKRPPNEKEGCDRMWVSAIDNVTFKNLAGVFRDYGVEFADNFGDFKDASVQDGLGTIEDVASYKARRVYEVTGLPCIASRTSFEVEPVATGLLYPGGGIPNANPRVVSGYRFNDVDMRVDYLVEALKPVSEPTRVTRFRTCLCYYDGDMEVFDYGVLDCDMHFSSSVRTFIPVAAAINEMCKTLQLTFGLEYQKWLKQRAVASLHGYGQASSKLRDRVLKEAKILPNSIIDVSTFMDSLVDVNLMDECAKELVSSDLLCVTFNVWLISH